MLVKGPPGVYSIALLKPGVLHLPVPQLFMRRGTAEPRGNSHHELRPGHTSLSAII